MFVGSINRDVRAMLAEIAPSWKGRPVYVGCSGNFTVERVVHAAGLTEMHGNDVSLYSCALGSTLARCPLAVGVKDDRFAWMSAYLEPGLPTVATLLLSLEYLKFVDRWEPYHTRMRQLYEDRWDVLHAQSVAKVQQVIDGVTLTSFTPGDVGAFVQEAPDDAVVVTFPPTYELGYERLYKKLAMATAMKASFGSFAAFVEFRAMTARAGVSFDTMQSRWAAMTDTQQQRYGTFEAYVRNQVLRKMARDAGLTWKTMRTDWDAMTAAQQKRYGDFEAFVRERVLRKMAREAGLKWKDMRADWKNMTGDQKTQFGDFETFVQTKLDDIAKRDEVTTSVGVTYDDPGFAVDDQEMTVRVRYDDPGWTPPRGAVSAQHGTPFRQFGGGTPAMLHGLERVMTAQEGRGIAAVIGNIQRSLGAIADLSGVAALAQRVAPVAAMAAGGMGTVTAPTLFLAGEAGPEQFAFSGADRRFGNETRDGRREASDLGALRQELADLKRIMERGQDELPFRMSRAIRDAIAETV